MAKSRIMKLAEIQPTIEGIVDSWLDDPNLSRTISYTLFKGRSTAAQTFSITAVCKKRKLSRSEFPDGGGGQNAERKYLIREADLPSGVTSDDLTLNDTITDGTAELTVTEINKSLDFVIDITAEGDR